MRWLRAWRRRHRDLEDARRHLEQSEAERPEVERLVRELRARRQTDYFSEQVRHAFGGRP